MSFSVVSHSDLGGCGDGMQVLRHGDALYVGHYGKSGMGTSVLDVSRPGAAAHRRAVARAGRDAHAQGAGGGRAAARQRGAVPEGATSGRRAWSSTTSREPLAPQRLGRFDGRRRRRAPHRVDGRPLRARVVHPAGHRRPHLGRVRPRATRRSRVEAARWELDEQQPAGKRYAAHHALLEGDIAYLGYGDAGLVALDVGDITQPRKLARLDWEQGGGTHTCLPLPGRGLVVVTDEQMTDGPHAPERLVRVVDTRERQASSSRLPATAGRLRRAGRRASARTTCTRTAPAATAASGSSSSRTSMPACASTTCAIPARPGGRALGAGAPPGRRRRSRTTSTSRTSGRVWVTDRFTRRALLPRAGARSSRS